MYAGTWTADAKCYFSKTGCAANAIGGDYLRGESIRQDYLETAISWAAAAEGESIEQYMAKHQNDANAVALWNYFRSVIDWAEALFPEKHKNLKKGLPWGLWYNEHKGRADLDPKRLEGRIRELLADPDVTRQSGVYEYLLTGNERALSIRAFDDRTHMQVYEEQGRKCAI